MNNKMKSDVENFLFSIEKILNEYSGLKIKLPIEENSDFDSDEITFGFTLDGIINGSQFIEMGEEIASCLHSILSEKINKFEILDWDILYNLKRELSLGLIFNDTETINEQLKYERNEFLNNLISIAGKTYESKPCDFGVILCEENILDKLADEFKFEVIHVNPNKSIKSFFESDKPFLKLIDGKNIILAVNKEYKVYSIVRIGQENINLSQVIIEQFNNYRLQKNLKKVKEYFIEISEGTIQKIVTVTGSKEEAVRGIIEMIRDGLNTAAYNSNYSCPEFTFFKANGGKLQVFNEHDFLITFSNGAWKIQNYHMLQ